MFCASSLHDFYSNSFPWCWFPSFIISVATLSSVINVFILISSFLHFLPVPSCHCISLVSMFPILFWFPCVWCSVLLSPVTLSCVPQVCRPCPNNHPGSVPVPVACISQCMLFVVLGFQWSPFDFCLPLDSENNKCLTLIFAVYH